MYKKLEGQQRQEYFIKHIYVSTVEDDSTGKEPSERLKTESKVSQIWKKDVNKSDQHPHLLWKGQRG